VVNNFGLLMTTANLKIWIFSFHDSYENSGVLQAARLNYTSASSTSVAVARSRMDRERNRRRVQYTPEKWRDVETRACETDRPANSGPFFRGDSLDVNPTVREQTLILDLLGRINYKIISGNRVYVEVGGIVYKTLYGGYWRSVFTGLEHYLLRCEQVSDSVWANESETSPVVDLPIAYSNEGWTASGHSLSFMLSRDS
jgi:hypothetical protein